MSSPLVSVVMPTYNRLAYLREAVESVHRQTFEDWELIIADDDSKDETAAYLADLATAARTRVIHLEHTGNPARVRNAAIAQARGDFIAFLDSDDGWLPRKLELQLAALQRRPHCLWSYTAFTRVDAHRVVLPEERSRPWSPCDGDIFLPLITTEASLRTPSVMVARQLLERVGGFDEQLDSAEDYDMWMRLSLESEIALVDEPLVYVRQNAGSYSHSKPFAAHISRDRSLRGMLKRVEPRRRAALRRERASNSLRHAAALAAADESRKLRRSLLQSLPYSWRYVHWWWGMSKIFCWHHPRLRMSRHLQLSNRKPPTSDEISH